jgi:hypothetical protein
MYKLFIDDLRDPVKLYDESDWVIARTYNDAITIIKERGAPNEISFDNDLGLQSTDDAYAVLKWLVYETDYIVPYIRVHSDNSVAAEQIKGLAINWHKHLQSEGMLDDCWVIRKGSIQILSEKGGSAI